MLQLQSRSHLLLICAQVQSVVEHLSGYTQRRGCRPIPASGGQHQYDECICHTENLLGEGVKGMFTCGKGIKKKFKSQSGAPNLFQTKLNIK